MVIRRERGLKSLFFGSPPKHNENFKLLKARYELLPPEIKALFSFNTGELIYDERGLPRNVLARTEWWAVELFGKLFKRFKPLIRIDEDIFLEPREDFYKVLMHELAHTLDLETNRFQFLDQPRNLKSEALKKAHQLWLKILEKEPFTVNGENNLLGGKGSKKIGECWAFRCGSTILIDYLIPANLVQPDDIELHSDLSADHFKVTRPWSYRFFHIYIKSILGHLQKKG